MEQGFHIFVKMYCLKFPSKCINLVQYMGIFNNLAGKFPFPQVYNYDKEFRQEMEEECIRVIHELNLDFFF